MFPRTVETAFARFQAKGEPRALAIVFDRTAPELMRLARHLAKDSSEAEDLLQATFLTAIESAQSHQHGRPVLPWLSGILANHARSTRRQNRRVPDRSRLANERVGDVHADVDERELRHEVLDAILRLPEVYRPVMRLWLEHGLEAHEIAATLERPAGTVRAQVTRGLDQLRKLLPASLATGAAVAVVSRQSLAAVREAVLAKCTGSTGLTGTLALGGLLLMHNKLTAAALAIVAAFATWAAWPPEADQPIPSTDDAVGVAAATAEVDGRARTESPTEAEATRREAAPTPPQPLPGEHRSISLTVAVVDAEDRSPCRGYNLTLASTEQTRSPWTMPACRRTDKAGKLVYTDLEPGRYYAFIDRHAQPTVVDITEDKRQTHVIELQPTGVIRGLVLNADGDPQPRAAVYMPDRSPLQPFHVATADREGRFELRHLSSVTLFARHRGMRPSLANEVKVARQQTADVTLQLEPGGRTISGTFVDTEGQPLANALVGIMPNEVDTVVWPRTSTSRRALMLRTNDKGAFATDEVAAATHVVVGYSQNPDHSPAHAKADTTDFDAVVTLRSPAPTVIEGRISGADHPDQLMVTAFPQIPDESLGGLTNLIGMRHTKVAADGSYRITGTIPGTIVVKAMLDSHTLTETVVKLAAGERADWSPVIGATAPLNVEVTAPSPLPRGLSMVLYPEPNGGTPLFELVDPDGLLELEWERKHPFQATLMLHQGRNNVIQLVHFRDVPAFESELKIELRQDQLPIGKVEGRLVDSMLNPISASDLMLRRADDSGLIVMVHAKSTQDGSFSIGPVPAGTYSLTAGTLTAPTPLRTVVVTAAGDEQVGDVTKP